MLENKSLLQNSKKFHLKVLQNKSMDNLHLNSAIKHSNVKNYVKKGLVISKENQHVMDNGDVELEEHLLQLKKSCSQLARQLKTKQIQSIRIRDQTILTQQKTNKIRNQRQLLQEKMAQLQKNIQKVNNKRQNADHSSKTFQHMLERMKKDDIHKQLQKNQLQRQLKALEKSRNMSQVHNYSTSQFQKLCSIGLKEGQNQLFMQKSVRKNNLNSINKQQNKKMSKQIKLSQRQKQTNQIQQLAACDIQDIDILRLKKFLTVQIFLRNLLKSKIKKLKNYYQPYQLSFFQIKSNTSVKDAITLKSQFFNYQTNYNQKIIWVKHLQQQIKSTEKIKKQLQTKLTQLCTIQIQNIQKLEQKQQKNKLKQNLKQLNVKSLEYQLLWERVKSWVRYQAKKLKIQCVDVQKCIQEIVKLMENKQQKQSVNKVADHSKIEIWVQ